MNKIIEYTGGIIEDEIFVTKPGAMIMSETKPSYQCETLLEELNCENIPEFNSKLTYLTYSNTSPEYLKKITQDYGHLSVWATTHIEFLLAGISEETMLELMAHREANFSRITSSKTTAMNSPLYRIQGTLEQKLVQKNAIKSYKEILNKITLSTEFKNMLHPGCKCNIILYSMNLKDYHRLFQGRLKNKGNETEVKEICEMMCNMLHNKYPVIIREPEFYKV